MKKKFYYKVVFQNCNLQDFGDKPYCSYFAIHSPWETFYKINEWAKAKEGKLFIFDQLKNAKRFVSTCPIFRCLAKGVKAIPDSLNRNCALYDWSIFWNPKKSKFDKEIIKNNISRFPIGTLWADEVMLLKQVHPKK